MCTAITYQGRDHYFGRTLDYARSYGEEVVIAPRNFPFSFRKMPELEEFQENPQIRERFRSAPYGGNYGTAPVSDFRPKAVAKPRRTAEENKPFIARGLDSLSGVNGLNRGGQGKAAALEYGQGDRVSHMKYGEGTVLQIEDSPRDYRVTVDFDRAGTKIMYAAFAKLKKL